MKQIILSLACITLIWIAFTTACKKEKDFYPFYHDKPPIANAGQDQIITMPSCVGSAIVELDGTGSSDPDDSTLGYLWSNILGTTPVSIKNSNSARAQLENIYPGTYEFELIVADAEGRKAKDTVRIIVTGPTNEYDLDISFHGSFTFQDNYEYCDYYACSYHDFTRFDGIGQFPPFGQLNMNMTEYTDSTSSVYASSAGVYIHSTFNNIYLGGLLSVNFKKLIQQGGGPFNGTLTIDNGSAQACNSNLSNNLPSLTVTGTLDVSSKLISMKINGKAIF